ncbi:MAG: DNA-binding IclR family transcriptional regulator [Verrucomicrobiales bacterium]|jgi:DNA-binding IclR family transcriptional regulator
MAGVQSIERAFAILRALSLGPAGVTDLSERTGLPKSTVSRLLSSLDIEEAVRQNSSGTYELGTGIDELGRALRGGQDAIDVARPHMIELMELTGEAVGINRFDGDSVRTLMQVDDPNSSVVVRDWTNEATPAHAVSAGLAILAHSSRAVQNNFLETDLDSTTKKTMTKPDELRKRFETIRRDGYAWVFQEFTDDINSVAAPITDSSGRTNLALHIHGPAFRFPNGIDIDELGQRVAATAERIEAQLLRA